VSFLVANIDATTMIPTSTATLASSMTLVRRLNAINSKTLSVKMDDYKYTKIDKLTLRRADRLCFKK